MSEPFIGEIRYFPYSFAPYGWFDCLGQMISIQQYPALYAVLGTRYGGNGSTTFGAPNLATAPGYDPTVTRLPTAPHVGISVGQGSVTLAPNQLPVHTHQLSRKKLQNGYVDQTSTATALSDLGGLANGVGSALSLFTMNAPNTVLAPATLTTYGSSQPHQNCQPYLVLRPCIAWDGIYPQRP